MLMQVCVNFSWFMGMCIYGCVRAYLYNYISVVVCVCVLVECVGVCVNVKCVYMNGHV